MDNQPLPQKTSTKEKTAGIVFVVTVLGLLFLLIFPLMRRDELGFSIAIQWFLIIFLATPIMLLSGLSYFSERRLRKSGTTKLVLRGKTLYALLITVAIIALIFYYKMHSVVNN